jgi:hypothetical protein
MTSFNEEFIEDISLVNPSSNVTDENNNLPLLELQHNIKFIANLLSVSSASSPNFLSLIYGNLLDYDNKGNKIFFNGGNLDCFEKKNAWIAVDDGAVENDTQIQNQGATNLLVYRGGVSYVDTQGEHGIWIEREFFIPPMLRGSELIFAVKGTGINTLADQIVSFNYEVPYCNVSTVPNISAVGTALCIGTSGTSSTPGTGSGCTPDLSTGCYARYEDIGIDVLGAQGTVQEIHTIGPWPHHASYAEDPSWHPDYRTVAVSFRVGKNTNTVKIRIRRTRADGVVAFSQMFLGGLPKPFVDYDWIHLDINELYNYTYGVTKFNATTVNGRHVAESCSTSKLPNLLTKEQFLCVQQFNRNLDEFDWDQGSGPRLTEIQFVGTMAPSSTPQTNAFEFDPGFTRYMHYDMRVDGPSPGLCMIGVSYFVNQNEFSDTITCPASSNPDGICGHVKFNVSVGILNSGNLSNPGNIEFKNFSYTVPIPSYTLDGKMGYFEVYGDFYQDLANARGAIAYFTISRDGESEDDTFQGNFLLVGAKTGIAVPPDDLPNAGSYPNLFVGDNSSC